MNAGYTVVPSVILKRQQALGLDATGVNILLHIMRHWWGAENLPFPSKKTIAKCMGIHERTVQSRIASMEADDLIKRKGRWHKTYGRQSNYYCLKGLVRTWPIRKRASRNKKTKRRRTRYSVNTESTKENMNQP